MSTCHIRSSFYKAISLYSSKKFQASIQHLSKVPDTDKLAMCANLYKGLCYQEKQHSNYVDAEQCFREVIRLYPSSDYADKDSVKSMAENALVINLINQEKFDRLLADINDTNIDIPDDRGNTLLMYATIHKKHVFAKQLIEEKSANPFHPNKYGDSPFSIALQNNDNDLVSMFVNQRHVLDSTDA